jgi:ribokinase
MKHSLKIIYRIEIPVVSVLFAAKKGYELGTNVILNPAPAQKLPEELFKYLYLITPNETEAEILTGIRIECTKTASEAASVLLLAGVQNVIITLGSQGAFFKNNLIELIIEAPKVTAVDTTAAGDVFNGVLAVEITSGNEWEAAIQTACKAASISVTRMGAQPSMPYKKEVEQFSHPLIEK